MSHFIVSGHSSPHLTPFLATHTYPPHPVVTSSGPVASAHSSPLIPQATYNGGYSSATTVRLRVANGGAGQAGLIGAFADAFIKWRVESSQEEPFKVEWYLGDTTQSLSYLSLGYVDVAFTYNKAAELAEIKSKKAVRRELVFMDHFYLVGPTSNPAALDGSTDDVSDMFNKIVGCGNVDLAIPPDPSERPPTRFLSRYDKSATNIKESELFIEIGQVPWALTYSSWYHQYPRFPIQALSAASLLEEYTLTDRGTWLSSLQSVTDNLHIFAQGTSASAICAPADSSVQTSVESDALLNPCNALLAVEPQDKDLAETFMDWLVTLHGGQEVVKTFVKNGEMLYTPATTE
ncbi:hypothetical protein IW261DRAFT_674593 [Armillaria novae-zelandiae]|uniref:PBP domain-containing protein n=1 Tax=Armillaria novae-zelandiae TaxID=153914 RepID=A0AA39NXK5_9AGAR|nr:hypothetical protein IW261DRAFT_674593 [Armillaria novae-zelandiae]